jgi:hypothetical protein
MLTLSMSQSTHFKSFENKRLRWEREAWSMIINNKKDPSIDFSVKFGNLYICFFNYPL